jgi:hypothetical protein
MKITKLGPSATNFEELLCGDTFTFEDDKGVNLVLDDGTIVCLESGETMTVTPYCVVYPCDCELIVKPTFIESKV